MRATRRRQQDASWTAHKATFLVREVANRIRQLDCQDPNLRPKSFFEVPYIIQSAQTYLDYYPSPALVVLIANLALNTSDGKQSIQQQLDTVWQWTVLKSYAAIASDTLDSFQAVPVASWADFRRRAFVRRSRRTALRSRSTDLSLQAVPTSVSIQHHDPCSLEQADAILTELSALLIGSDADELICATLEHAGGFAMGETACIDYDFLLVLNGKRPTGKGKGKAKAGESIENYQAAVNAIDRVLSPNERSLDCFPNWKTVAVGTAECFADWHDLPVVMLRWRDTDEYIVHVDIPVTCTDRKGATAVWWSSAASFVGGLQRSGHAHNEAFSAGGYYRISGTVVAPRPTPTEAAFFGVAQLQLFGAPLRHSDIPRWPHLTIDGDSVAYDNYLADGWVCSYQWGHLDPPPKDEEDALRGRHDPPFVGRPREPTRSSCPFSSTAVLPEDSDAREEGDAEPVKDASLTPLPVADPEVVEKPPADSSPLPSVGEELSGGRRRGREPQGNATPPTPSTSSPLTSTSSTPACEHAPHHDLPASVKATSPAQAAAAGSSSAVPVPQSTAQAEQVPSCTPVVDVVSALAQLSSDDLARLSRSVQQTSHSLAGLAPTAAPPKARPPSITSKRPLTPVAALLRRKEASERTLQSRERNLRRMLNDAEAAHPAGL
ncbi:hypothetical protein JCM10296v2_004255 [Rhodotorula toruloides]